MHRYLRANSLTRRKHLQSRLDTERWIKEYDTTRCEEIENEIREAEKQNKMNGQSLNLRQDFDGFKVSDAWGGVNNAHLVLAISSLITRHQASLRD